MLWSDETEQQAFLALCTCFPNSSQILSPVSFLCGVEFNIGFTCEKYSLGRIAASSLRIRAISVLEIAETISITS